MDRRKYIKAMALGSIATGVILEACSGPSDKPAPLTPTSLKEFDLDRMPEEKAWYESITSTTFFTAEEMATITVLADIIIPADDISGSASDAGVPDFIEFIVKDMPEHQVPMRGGLRWLNMQCLKRYEKPFSECSREQQIEIVDAIAYPAKASPEMSQGVTFFNRMRNLTATGFYTSKIGVEDLGYAGNKPNQWKGVPDEVLKQYNLAYTERDIKESVQFDA